MTSCEILRSSVGVAGGSDLVTAGVCFCLFSEFPCIKERMLFFEDGAVTAEALVSLFCRIIREMGFDRCP